MSNKTDHDDYKKNFKMSRCANCLSNKSVFDKIKHKSDLETIVSQFLID